MERILVDETLLKNLWVFLGHLCDFLEKDGKDRGDVQRFGDFCAKVIIGNHKYSYNTFTSIRRTLQQHFDYQIVKADNTGWTVEDFGGGNGQRRTNRRTVEMARAGDRYHNPGQRLDSQTKRRD